MTSPPTPKPDTPSPAGDALSKDRIDSARRRAVHIEAGGEFRPPSKQARAFAETVIAMVAELARLRAENARMLDELRRLYDVNHTNGELYRNANDALSVANAELARLRAVLAAILGGFVVGSELPDSHRFTVKVTFTAGEHRELSAALATNTTQGGREDDDRT